MSSIAIINNHQLTLGTQNSSKPPAATGGLIEARNAGRDVVPGHPYVEQPGTECLRMPGIAVTGPLYGFTPLLCTIFTRRTHECLRILPRRFA